MRKLITWLLALMLIFSLAGCSDSKVASTTATATKTVITLGDTISVSGTGATANGNAVNIKSGGTYSISGKLTDGQVKVNTKEKVNIELNGVEITNKSGPALFIEDAKKATVKLVSGTTNKLTDAKSSNENDAPLFTNDTLVIEGQGTLVVTGNNMEGISSDDDIIINSGTIRVTAVDDGLNAHDDITINGGYVYVVANGDGLDSNGTLNITGGTVISQGSTAGGDGGTDSTGTFTITGGTVISTGNTSSAPNSDSTQNSVYISSGTNQVAGTLVRVELDGKEILTFAPARTYQNVLYSSPKLTANASYKVLLGGSSKGKATDGLYAAGTYTASSSTTPISVIAAITPSGAGQMGPGGPGGQMRHDGAGGNMPPDGGPR